MLHYRKKNSLHNLSSQLNNLLQLSKDFPCWSSAFILKRWIGDCLRVERAVHPKLKLVIIFNLIETYFYVMVHKKWFFKYSIQAPIWICTRYLKKNLDFCPIFCLTGSCKSCLDFSKLKVSFWVRSLEMNHFIHFTRQLEWFFFFNWTGLVV